MKAAFHLGWIFVLVCTASAADPQESANQVNTLKSQYNAALAKSVQTINEAYKNQLLELQKKYMAAKDNAAIAAVRAELEKIGVHSPVLASAQAPAGTPPPTAPATVPGMGATTLFVGRAWYSASGEKYYFKDDGTGYREQASVKIPFTWLKQVDGLIEVKGRKEAAANASIGTWFFQFTNKKTALFGVSKSDMPDTLTTER